MRIKGKILIGFLIIIAVLAVAGGVSIYEFLRISGLVKDMIKDNYKTIQSGKAMMEALERKDSGVLLLFLGQFKQGSAVLQTADSLFLQSLEVATGNITEPGEDKLVEQIRRSYNQYSSSVNITDSFYSVSKLKWYQDVVHPRFYEAKEKVNDLININQEAMFIEATQLEQQSKRALMPGIVALTSSLLFLLMLNFFISKYFVHPIVTLTSEMKKVQANRNHRMDVKIETNDEIGELASTIDKLTTKLNQFNISE